MLRILRLVIVLGIGFYAGMTFNTALMRAECSAGTGEWTGTICVNSELLQ